MRIHPRGLEYRFRAKPSNYYAHSPARNSTGPATGQAHTRRGGGLITLKNGLRVTGRVGGVYHWADGEAGFRCALSAAGMSASVSSNNLTP